jgi:hypothetical protein
MIPTFKFLMDSEIALHSKKQEIWRQKQLDIFYRTGKPIFRVSNETQHIRSNIDPLYFKEKRPWET